MRAVTSAVVLFVLLALPAQALADTFNENFESLSVRKPSESWYSYAEGADIGNVSTSSSTNMIISGSKSFLISSPVIQDSSSQHSDFDLATPVQLPSFNFTVQANPYSNGTNGTQQYISIDSGAPARSMVQFFLICNDPVNSSGCAFNVRWQEIDSTGQTLINGSLNQTRFVISITVDWLNSQYDLNVNGVDDGIYPFYQIPENVGRIRFAQLRNDVRMNMTFDDWTVNGAINGTPSAVDGDIANGIKNFAIAIHFQSSGALFFLGILIFIVLCAAVIVPLLSLGLDNTVIPAIGFFAVLAALWMIFMEFWPAWVGIALIVAVSALVGTITRRLFLGVNNANFGPSLVAGSLGYFIIATALLAFSGYATATISTPSQAVEQNTATENGTVEHHYIFQTFHCLLTLYRHCDEASSNKAYNNIVEIFSWAKASVQYLFDLLTFQLPIPIIFNVMIVVPPAASLAAYAIEVIRGK